MIRIASSNGRTIGRDPINGSSILSRSTTGNYASGKLIASRAIAAGSTPAFPTNGDVVQRLEYCTCNAEVSGSIPDIASTTGN